MPRMLQKRLGPVWTVEYPAYLHSMTRTVNQTVKTWQNLLESLYYYYLFVLFINSYSTLRQIQKPQNFVNISTWEDLSLSFYSQTPCRVITHFYCLIYISGNSIAEILKENSVLFSFLLFMWNSIWDYRPQLIH